MSKFIGREERLADVCMEDTQSKDETTEEESNFEYVV